MNLTGIEDYYIVKNGEKLHFGYTTGTCAAAAAKAAALMLTGRNPESVVLTVPKGITLTLEVLEKVKSGYTASCAVRKYSGDDPDVTDGILVYAEVSLKKEPGLILDGGIGVGRVTKPGLKQKIGEAAINPVPRQMILNAVQSVLDDASEAPGAFIRISIPAGTALAAKTFNPRLGIEGGISVLGTSGIVEPMSESALIESIGLELRQKHALGADRLIVVPGNYGLDFYCNTFGGDRKTPLKCSNYIGETIDIAAAEGIKEFLLIGNIGKMIKVAGGVMNTHSRIGDVRSEVMAACALRAGADGNLGRKILDCLTTEEMLSVLESEKLLEKTMQQVCRQIDFHLHHRAGEEMKIGAVVFSNERGILCETENAVIWHQEEMKK